MVSRDGLYRECPQCGYWQILHYLVYVVIECITDVNCFWTHTLCPHKETQTLEGTQVISTDTRAERTAEKAIRLIICFLIFVSASLSVPRDKRPKLAHIG